jgi:hypothetical protein
MARVGILVECGPDGLEVHLCRRICALLRTERGIELEEQIVPMDNRSRLLAECVMEAGNLLAGGCERIVILWDERPSWPSVDEALCWSRERGAILSALRGQGLAGQPVYLVCIEREFESWLLFDERLLSAVLSTPEHPRRVKAPRNPHRIPNPKGAMMRLFKRHGHKRYVDSLYARRLAAALENLTRLRGCETFRRFEAKLTGRAGEPQGRR